MLSIKSPSGSRAFALKCPGVGAESTPAQARCTRSRRSRPAPVVTAIVALAMLTGVGSAPGQAVTLTFVEAVTNSVPNPATASILTLEPQAADSQANVAEQPGSTLLDLFGFNNARPSDTDTDHQPLSSATPVDSALLNPQNTLQMSALWSYNKETLARSRATLTRPVQRSEAPLQLSSTSISPSSSPALAISPEVEGSDRSPEQIAEQSSAASELPQDATHTMALTDALSDSQVDRSSEQMMSQVDTALNLGCGLVAALLILGCVQLAIKALMQNS